MRPRQIGGRVDAEQARRADAERLREQVTRDVFEATAAVYAQIFDRVLDGLGATNEQQAEARELLREELRKLTGGPEA